ncbi:hypothetical protein MMC29_006016 [Sticta canariensis]|nr:hypothetical protein [Sticta canariensis]
MAMAALLAIRKHFSHFANLTRRQSVNEATERARSDLRNVAKSKTMYDLTIGHGAGGMFDGAVLDFETGEIDYLFLAKERAVDLVQLKQNLCYAMTNWIFYEPTLKTVGHTIGSR